MTQRFWSGGEWNGLLKKKETVKTTYYHLFFGTCNIYFAGWGWPSPRYADFTDHSYHGHVMATGRAGSKDDNIFLPGHRA